MTRTTESVFFYFFPLPTQAQLQQRRPCFLLWKHPRPLIVLERSSPQASCRLRLLFESLMMELFGQNPPLFLLLDQNCNILACHCLRPTKQDHLGSEFCLIHNSIFCRLFNVGRYYFLNLSQMRSEYACVFRKSFPWLTNSCAQGRYGKQTFWLPSRKWFGVIDSKSFTSELTGVKGLAFVVCSTRHIVVERTSSVIDRFPNTEYIAFLQLLTSLSHTPPNWVAAGGLNFHLIPCWTKCSSILSLFHAATYSLNSRSAPKKFIPLSLIIFMGLPLRAMNGMIVFRQLWNYLYMYGSYC